MSAPSAPPSPAQEGVGAFAFVAFSWLLAGGLAFSVLMGGLSCRGGCGGGGKLALLLLIGALSAVCWYVIAKAVVRASAVGGAGGFFALVALVPSVIVNAVATYLFALVLGGAGWSLINRMGANPSIERTSKRLRLFAAAHVER
jgi:hypothetical protein